MVIKNITVLGTRPEIAKLSPLIPLLDKEFRHILVHTGQHYDHEMDGIFFEELKLRKPDYNLAIGSKPTNWQVGEMLMKLEEIFVKEKPTFIEAVDKKLIHALKIEWSELNDFQQNHRTGKLKRIVDLRKNTPLPLVT